MVAFVAPDYLWLLLLLLPVWGVAVAARGVLPAWRLWPGLLLRTLGIVALVLALAGMQLVRPATQPGVVFLLDVSDSVPLSQRAAAEAYIQQALAQMPADALSGIVLFGERAVVERLPDDSRTLGHLEHLPPGGQTNIQDAVLLGKTLLPADSRQRLVLLSDGGENRGDALAAARSVAARGVPIDVVITGGGSDGLDGQISSIELPSVVGAGQGLRMVIHIESRGPPEAWPLAARLVVEERLTGTDSPQHIRIAEQTVQLRGEPQQFTLRLPPPSEHFARYVVRLEAPGDGRTENNVAEAFSFVRGQPRVLLVEGNAGVAEHLAQPLVAATLEVERVSPDDLPSALSALIAYDAIVLVDVPSRALDKRTDIALATYVRDLGRGLAMVGGEQSFGAGNWRNTFVEEALPVAMDIRTPELRQPPVSIVVIIDVSGSMGNREGGYTKIQLAAEGAARIASLIRDEDEITVIPFDSQSQGMIGPLPGTRRDEAIERIATIGAGGGGINAYDALQEAAAVIRQRTAPVRHIIMIADGNDTQQQEGARDLVRSLQSEGVTISAVAVGSGGDVPFLRDVVSLGEGRFFLTMRAADIPTILTHEAHVVIQPLVQEGEFAPRNIAPHPIVRDLSPAFPPLYGYVSTTPEARSQVILQTEKGEPLLVVWQYGLGRSLAWTSDLSGKWARDLLGWPDYQRFVTQMIAWLLPAENTQRMTLDAQMVGGSLVLVSQVQTETGTPATGLQVAGQIVASNGVQRAVVLREVAPGRYRTTIDDAPPGVSLVQLLATDAQGQPVVSVTGGAMVPFSAEYRSGGENPALLHTLATLTGGRTNPPPAAVSDPVASRGEAHVVREIAFPLVWAALALLVLDVVWRRILWRAGGASFRRVGVGGDGRPAIQQPPPTLRGQPHDKAPPPQPTPAPEDPLDRLRAAQERARKRVRGESDE